MFKPVSVGTIAAAQVGRSQMGTHVKTLAACPAADTLPSVSGLFTGAQASPQVT